MKLRITKKRAILILIPVLVLLVAGFFWQRNWFKANRDRIKVEKTVSQEIAKLSGPLKDLGFNDLHNLTTECGYITPPRLDNLNIDTVSPYNDTYFECSSGIDRFTKLPTKKQELLYFNENAAKLDKILRQNGWKSREDYPTVPWFKAISEGVDYQPDQLNTKTVNGLECIVDFFTAFSKPDTPAMSVHVFCNVLQETNTP